MATKISALIPNVEDLLALEVEEVDGILLLHLLSFGTESGDGRVSRGGISQYNFFNILYQRPEYSTQKEEVSKALMEGWNWLAREGILIPDARQTQSPWFFVSRRAKRLQSRDDFAAYRHASLLPKGNLHELIAAKVYPAFLRGEYDTAVFQAFREVEIVVRDACGFPDDMVGVELMRQALRAVNRPDRSTTTPGPPTDTTLPIAEQEGMANLFAGGIAL